MMRYWTGVAINFALVLFIVRFAPGLAEDYSAPSPLAGDLLFSFFVGILNGSVFHLLILVGIFPSKMKLASLNGLISFGSFSLIAMIPFGFEAGPGGIVIGGSLTWLISFLVSYFAMRKWVDEHKQ